MKWFRRKYFVAVFLIVLPLTLFFKVCGAVSSKPKLRDDASWRPRKIVRFSKTSIERIAVSPDERRIASASNDEKGIVVIHDMESGKEVARTRFGHRIEYSIFSADGRKLAVAWSKTTEHKMQNSTHHLSVALWDLGKTPRNFEAVKGDLIFDAPEELRFSPDGKTLWMASSDNLRAWNLASGKLQWQWHDGDGTRDSSFPVQSALSKDCRLNFRSDSSGYSVWDTKTRKELLRKKIPFLYDAGLEFSPDNSLATYYGDAFTENEGIVYPVIDTRTGRELWRYRNKDGMNLIGDNKAIGFRKNTFEVLNARTGKHLYNLPAIPTFVPLSIESKRWLYTRNPKGEMYRQRLQ